MLSLTLLSCFWDCITAVSIPKLDLILPLSSNQSLSDSGHSTGMSRWSVGSHQNDSALLSSVGGSNSAFPANLGGGQGYLLRESSCCCDDANVGQVSPEVVNLQIDTLTTFRIQTSRSSSSPTTTGLTETRLRLNLHWRKPLFRALLPPRRDPLL